MGYIDHLLQQLRGTPENIWMKYKNRIHEKVAGEWNFYDCNEIPWKVERDVMVFSRISVCEWSRFTQTRWKVSIKMAFMKLSLTVDSECFELLDPWEPCVFRIDSAFVGRKEIKALRLEGDFEKLELLLAFRTNWMLAYL